MAKPSIQPLQSNPFITYRDPQTGQWVVQKTNLSEQLKPDSSITKFESLKQDSSVTAFNKLLPSISLGKE